MSVWGAGLLLLAAITGDVPVLHSPTFAGIRWLRDGRGQQE